MIDHPLVKARKYNPGFLSDAALIAGYCVRLPELAMILETLRENVVASNQHVLTLGPRGSGKSTLLLRVVAECHRDPDLHKIWLPVVFMEESYEIQNIGEFWLECLYHLARSVEDETLSLSLLATHKKLMGMLEDVQVLAERARAQVLDVADRMGKRLLLVVENLNMLFAQMDHADDVGWKLRHTLQNEPRLMLLASATSRFEQIDHQDKALFELFRLIPLHRLTTEECAALWQRVSGQQTEKTTIRAMEILTGGNPRLLTIVSIFGANKSFVTLMDELLDLVDDHTDYFKSHLDSLPPRERRVYVAVADLWRPATAREISQRARQDIRLCSSLLNRLLQRGIVTEDPNSKPRKKRYYLTERLFNIYYLLRRQRQPDAVVTALVHFMTAYYPPRDWLEIGVNMLHEMQTGSQEIKSLILCAFSHMLPHLGGTVAGVDAAREFAERLVVSYAGLNDDSLSPEARERLLNEKKRLLHALEERGDEIRHEILVIAMQDYALANMNNDNWEEASHTWGQIIARFSHSASPDMQNLVALVTLMHAMIYEVDHGEKSLDRVTSVLTQQTGKGTVETTARWFQCLLLEDLQRQDEALVALHNLLICVPNVNNLPLESIIALCIRQTVYHGPRKLLDQVLDSPMELALQPLVVALKQELGEEVCVAVEVREVAADIRAQIQALRTQKTAS